MGARSSGSRAPARNPMGRTSARWARLEPVRISKIKHCLSGTVGPLLFGSDLVPSVVVLTAQQQFTSTTPAAITGLAFPVLAGSVYRFSFWFAASSNANANGPGFGMSWPAATVACLDGRYPENTVSNNANVNGLANATIVTSGQAPFGGSVTTGTDTHLSKVEGFLIPSANGTIQALCRCGSASMGSTITVRPGSHGLLWLLP